MVVLFIMYIVIGLLNKTLDPSLQNYGGTGVTFFQIFAQPWLWSTNSFILFLISAVGLTAGITTAIGLATKSDILTLAGFEGIIMTMGSYAIWDLDDFITRNVGQFINCVPNQACLDANILGALTELFWFIAINLQNASPSIRIKSESAVPFTATKYLPLRLSPVCAV